MMSYHTPLMDITNIQDVNIGKPQKAAQAQSVAPTTARFYRHDPYAHKCVTTTQQMAAVADANPDLFVETADYAPAAPNGPAQCEALVQFKCHQTEYQSPIMLYKGQYVAVQGDRGMDIGVVIGVNTESEKGYVGRNTPTHSVVRHATQMEVNYWATDLKEAEAAAVDYCRKQVHHHRYEMDVVQAEYQFDKKKLTFYYVARSRIDFVPLLKELYREFGCRIWMEKVRMED